VRLRTLDPITPIRLVEWCALTCHRRIETADRAPKRPVGLPVVSHRQADAL